MLELTRSSGRRNQTALAIRAPPHSPGDLVFVFNFHPTTSFTDYRVGCYKAGPYKVTEAARTACRPVRHDTNLPLAPSPFAHTHAHDPPPTTTTTTAPHTNPHTPTRYAAHKPTTTTTATTTPHTNPHAHATPHTNPHARTHAMP
jgi:hypothetical protein